MAGTLFSGTRVPLQLWFYAMLFFADSAEGTAGPFLERQLGISGPTAFRLCQRIRQHIAMLDGGRRIGRRAGVVSAELVKVLHIVNRTPNVQNSAMIFLLSDADRVDATVVVKPSQSALRSLLRTKVHPDAQLITRCHLTFRVLSNYNSGRPIAEFRPEHFADGSGNLDSNHGFMQYFNLSFANQFRGVSLDNAWLYFKEYEFRYNRRRSSSESFTDLISQFPSFDVKDLARTKARNFLDGANPI